MNKKPKLNARLPFPRLELRWRKPNPKTPAEAGNEFICDYMLVLDKPSVGDARSNGPKGAYARLNVEYVLNSTGRSGGPAMGKDFLDAPFRDGAHATWDAPKLGNLPVFITFGKYSAPYDRN